LGEGRERREGRFNTGTTELEIGECWGGLGAGGGVWAQYVVLVVVGAVVLASAAKASCQVVGHLVCTAPHGSPLGPFAPLQEECSAFDASKVT